MPARFIPHVDHGLARASVYFFVFIRYGSYITALWQVKYFCVGIQNIFTGFVDGLLKLVCTGLCLFVGRDQLRNVLLMQPRVSVSGAVDSELNVLGGLVCLAARGAQPGEQPGNGDKKGQPRKHPCF